MERQRATADDLRRELDRVATTQGIADYDALHYGHGILCYDLDAFTRTDP